MNDEWWEGTVCFICDYWWLLLLILVLGLAAYFTHNYWWPYLQTTFGN